MNTTVSDRVFDLRLAHVQAEMGRVYRACRNGKVHPADLGTFIFALKTMRDGLPEEGAEAANAIKEIHIQSIPVDNYIINNRTDEVTNSEANSAMMLEYRPPPKEVEPPVEIFPPELESEPVPEPIKCAEPDDDGGVVIMRPPRITLRFPKSSY
jgi:hypothetical protein